MKIRVKINGLASAILSATLALSFSVNSAPVVDLATVPLTSGTTSNVLPNLMFILDRSGSMGWDFTPDHMGFSGTQLCKDAGDKDNVATLGSVSGTTRVLDRCHVGDVPSMFAGMNSQYYNPSIRYNPGVNANGTSRPIQSTPTSVLTDAYDIQKLTTLKIATTSTNLTDQYPIRLWCTKNTPTAAELSDKSVCRENTANYDYPDATFKYGETTSPPTATGYLMVKKMCQGTDQYDSNCTFSPDAWGNYNDHNNNIFGMFKLGAPYYFSVIVSEFCSAPDLKTCISASAPSAGFTFPALSRWCDSSALTNCQALNTGNFNWPRYIGANPVVTAAVAAAPEVLAVPAFGTVASVGKVTLRNRSSLTGRIVTSIRVGSVEILGGTITGTSTMTSGAMAILIRNQINAFASTPEYTATSSGDEVTIRSTVAAGASANGVVSYPSCTSCPINGKNDMAGGLTTPAVAYQPPIVAQPAGLTWSKIPYVFTRTNIVPTTTSYPKVAGRDDCAGATCTYAEEVTNFGNWYAYYRTRMQSMKSAASIAFAAIGDNFRVGFIDIYGNASDGGAGKGYQKIDKFDATVKGKWYDALFSSRPSGGTPLRSALSRVGRIFAGKGGTSYPDPVQYSCQQNFALLTTDGFWNGDTGATDVKNIADTGSVGNTDAAGSTARPQSEGPDATSDTLSDVAKYYYDTDLRTGTSDSGSCTGARGAGFDVCANNVFVSGTDNNVKQHMTTFTLGLGVDGALLYSNDYKIATTGDFAEIKAGTKNWSVPESNEETTVDDLWHAAVNGNGTYFSAKDPATLTKSLKDALSQINSKVGAGAAAATSTLNPVAGDNAAYVASYATVKWSGNLEARGINLSTGEVSESATWCVEDVVSSACSAPSSIVSQVVSGSTYYYCVTPSVTVCAAPGSFGDSTTPGVGIPTTSCKVEIQASCTGTMRAKVAATSDTRTIYMNKGGVLADFSLANMSSTQAAYFSPGVALSQWSTLDVSTQQPNASGANLVNYLRGHTGYEERESNLTSQRVFRVREATLGDALESPPVFVKKPIFNYSDSGYDAFKVAKSSRDGIVYLGANDGMLHAFDAVTGVEKWAFVPTVVMPNMWKLADRNYATKHTNYVNGATTIADVCSSGCTAWKTILIGALNGGGKGFYALDITNPSVPQLMWEFGAAQDSDVGFSFANPVITKMENGTWVVLVTSGYNNTSGTNAGKGVLFVLNANTGAVIRKLITSAGSAASPSGLGKLAAYADQPNKNNTVIFTYAGDLDGNLWRFDINNAQASGSNPLKLAILKDPSDVVQPITTRPELGEISGKRWIFVGTGKYLETGDLSNAQQQTVYAFPDNDALIDDPRESLQQQVLTTDGSSRTATSNTVAAAGWYAQLPDSKERQHVNARLIGGTLVVPTTVPEASECTPGGYGWLNYFDYKTGSAPVGTKVSSKTNAPIVGFNYIYIAGKPVISVVTSDKPTPEIIPGATFVGATSGFVGKRAVWREVVPQ